MIALLAIKPEFADKILSGKKQYEFRRTSFADPKDVKFIYLYSSNPKQKIVGGFTTDRVTKSTPDELWEQFGAESGISREDRFLSYFDGVDLGYAIHVNRSFEFSDPVDPEKLFDEFTPPVSFRYLDSDEARRLGREVSPERGNGEEVPLPRFADD